MSTTSMDHPSYSSSLRKSPVKEGKPKFSRKGPILKYWDFSVLVWNNWMSQRTILHVPGCLLPENFINQC